MIANQTATHPEPVFSVKNHYVCKFIYLKNKERHEETQMTYADMVQYVKESPFGGVVDVGTFWQLYWTDPDFKKETDAHPYHVYQNMCILQTGLYMAMNPIEQWIVATPIIGIFYRIMMFYFIDMAKIYTVLNIVYWLSKARSSREISSLVPRDPYLYSKRFVAWITDANHIWVGYVLRADLLFDLFPLVVETLSRIIRKGESIRAFQGADGVSQNPWLPDAYQWLTLANQYVTEGKDFRAVIGSPTATGKSTWFLWALLKTDPRCGLRPKRIWLLVPRRRLRTDWDDPTHGGLKVQKLKAGVEIKQDSELLICTYGHAINRYNEFAQGDIFCLDESHEGTGEYVQISFDLSDHASQSNPFFEKPNIVFYLSATPPKRTPGCEPMLLQAGPNVKQRFKTTIIERNADVINNFQYLLTHFPDHAKNALIISPLIKEIPGIIEGLTNLKLGVPITEVSSRTEGQEIPEGIRVGTAIVDAGITLKNCSAVIDSGDEVQIHKGQFVSRIDEHGRRHLPFSRSHTAIQRAGRTGRQTDGIVIRPTYAGVAPDIVSYPAGGRFAHRDVASWYNMPRLMSPDNPSNVNFPYYALPTTTPERLIPGIQFVIHAAFAGMNSSDWMNAYNGFFLESRPLREEFEVMNKWMAPGGCTCTASYTEVLAWISKRNITYNFGGRKTTGSMYLPVRDAWREYDQLGSDYWRLADDLVSPPPDPARKAVIAHEKRQNMLLASLFLRHYCACGRNKPVDHSKCQRCVVAFKEPKPWNKLKLHQKVREDAEALAFEYGQKEKEILRPLIRLRDLIPRLKEKSENDLLSGIASPDDLVSTLSPSCARYLLSLV